MTNFDLYGSKEVMDFTLYTIDDLGGPGAPVLKLDTLKMSTVEFGGAQVMARGGHGNPVLLVWNHSKDVTVNIEDALFSPKSMAVILADTDQLVNTTSGFVWKTAKIVAGSAGITAADIVAADKDVSSTSQVDSTSLEVYDAAGSSLAATAAVISTPYLVKYKVLTKNVATITINGDSFPGIYYGVGDTYVRNQVTGVDEPFQFIIPKVAINPENTITLEAEGDPTVFNMSLTAMRDPTGAVMKMVKYELA